MKVSYKLYELINSLSQNERGYFVKFVQAQGSNSEYLELFKALCQMKTYEPGKFLKEYASAGFLKNLAYSQNYLHRNILKSLRLYYENQQTDIQLYAMLSEASILELKGLNKQSMALLKRVKKKALLHHEYLILIEVLKKQANLIVAMRGQKLLEETQQIYVEIFEALNTLEEEYTYRRLNHNILLCYRNGAWGASDEYPELLKSISDHPAMEEKLIPHSFYARYMKHKIRYIEAQVYGDHQLAHSYYLRILKVWEDHPDLIRANPHLYKLHLSNFLGNALFVNRIDEFEKYIGLMEELEPRNQREKIETFQNVVYFRLLFYLNQRQLNEGIAYVQSVEASLNNWSEKLNHSRAIAIYYNIVILYFLMEHFEECQKWLNLILHEQNKEIRRDVKFFARLFSLILHFELQHTNLLDYLYVSTKRKQNNRTLTGHYENTILKYFKLLINSMPGKVQMAAFRNFREALMPFKKQVPEPISIDELLIWIKARIEKKSLHQVYTETVPDLPA